MVDNELYVLSSWMPEHGVSGLFGQSLPFWGFPALMWLASLIVAWLAAEHQMLRHIRALRDAMVTFGKGQRMIALPDLSRAPNELRDVGQAFDRMVDGVLHDAAELEDAVHQKEVLLREVHHRVKNNLQLIASIMNLQMRKAFSPEAKLLVKGLHDRVMSLATVHRELYQTSGLTDVRADELFVHHRRAGAADGEYAGARTPCRNPFRFHPPDTGSGGAAVADADRGAGECAQACTPRSA